MSETTPASHPQPSPAAFATGDATKMNAYLDEQTALIRMQIEDMKRDEAIHARSLRVRHAADILKLALELAVAAAVVIVAIAFGAMLWSASRANGLVIEAFSVPPDLQQRGLTGEVIAAKILDRLATLQAETVSNRPPSSYANNWDNDIKLQIPQTGVSFGELNRFLRGWLGHETHITGEIYRTADGLSITARTGMQNSPTFSGKESEIDALIGKAAEAVYGATQPYRYAVYLDEHGQTAKGQQILRRLLLAPSVEERAWALGGLAQQIGLAGDFATAIALQKKGLALKPDMLLGYENLAAYYGSLGWDELSLQTLNRAVSLAASGRDTMMNANFFAVNPIQDRSNRDLLIADYQSVLALDRRLLAAPDLQTWQTAYQNDLDACGSLHDPVCVAEHWAAIPQPTDALGRLSYRGALQVAYADLGYWDKVLEIEPEISKALAGAGDFGRFFVRHLENPLAALAHAGQGNFATANRLAADTPLDCAKCLIVRGRIAAMAHNWKAAEDWYRRAVAISPSIPLAYTDWGQVLLARGDIDGAIAKFRDANRKGPHFADPLVYWGEALMQQNRSDLALAKFTEAARYAPNWGRLHLKWGEALHYAGKEDEAKKHFAVARRLFLTKAEQGELAGLKWS